MKCQAAGCEKEALIDDDDTDDSLCLCAEHQGFELVHYVELPDYDTLPTDKVSIARRAAACKVYKDAMRLAK